MAPVAFYPNRGRVLVALTLGGALMFGAYRLWPEVGGKSAEPSLAWIWPLLLFIAGNGTFAKAVRALVQPHPSFACDAHGFSVMGRAKRPWAEFRGVSVRSVSVAGIPLIRWVRVSFHAGATWRSGHCDIPWSHLIGPADEIAGYIEKAAVKHRPRQSPTTPSYDPYDPAALSLARARAH